MTGSSLTSTASDVRVQGAQVGGDGAISVPSGTAIAAGAGGYPVSVPTGSAVLLTIPPGGTLPPPASHAIVGQASGKCLDITGHATADATPIQLWSCTGADNQAWSLSGGAVTNPASGKCLDVAAASATNGAAVQLYTCNGTGAQQWSLAANGELVNANSGKCLDAVSKGTVNGTKLQIWSCTAASNQIWSLS
jgi:endoglucanase